MQEEIAAFIETLNPRQRQQFGRIIGRVSDSL